MATKITTSTKILAGVYTVAMCADAADARIAMRQIIERMPETEAFSIYPAVFRRYMALRRLVVKLEGTEETTPTMYAPIVEAGTAPTAEQAAAAGRTTKTTTTVKPMTTIYQVSVSIFRPYDGEYFVAYYANSIAAAQRLLVAAIQAEGWKLDDYDVAEYNGTSVSTIRKAISDNYQYFFDAGHGNTEGKPRVLANIASVGATTDRKLQKERMAFGTECATALAAGKLGDVTAREIRLKQAYPSKPVATTTEVVDYRITGLTEADAYHKQVDAATSINLALKAGQAVLLRVPGHVDALVVSAQIFPERGTNLPRLHLQLEDSVEKPTAALDTIVIQPPTPRREVSGLLFSGCPTNQKSTLRLARPRA